jgi:KaiC/GvpD/RAD55 family RecA-like ATPase
MNETNKIYPFKFLDSYTKEDTSLFFGRDEEIDRLYEMIFQTSILMIYGASGTGKTSLIQCGLASKFQEHDWLSIFVRRGGDLNASLQKALEQGDEKNAHKENLDWLDDLLGDEPSEEKTPKSSLAKAFETIYLQHYRPIYLIFDQFEELYILGDKAEQEQFVQTVTEILALEQPIKIIISIREEYLGYLYDFEKVVPQLLRKKLRVEPMNLDKVRQVLQGVTTLENSNIHIPAQELDALTEGIFNKIKGKDKEGNIKKGLTIQLPYFQVFLDKLYLKTTDDKSRQADAIFTNTKLAELGEISDVLRNFLDEQVLTISHEEQVKLPELTEENIWKILSPFVTLEGTKKPITKAELLNRLNFSTAAIDATLNALTSGRIIRYTEEGELYEVAHDALALQIAAKRTDEEIALLEIKYLIDSQLAFKDDARELFTEKQLNFIDTYLVKLRAENLIDNEGEQLIASSRTQIEAEAAARKAAEEAEKQQLIAQAEKDRQLREAAEKEKKRARIFSFVAILVAIAAATIAFFAYSFYKDAQNRLFEIKKQQAINVAEELKSYGDSYRDLQKADYACENYQQALDTIKNYKEEQLYIDLTKLLKQCE